MLACTFVHTKFHHRTPRGKALLRCFLGGTRDPDVLNLGNEEVVSLVRREIRDILNFSRQPQFYRIHSWPSSMAQYTVGHAERVQKIDAQLQNHPGLFLAGNAYSGIGISDCVRTGRAAAERALGLAKSRDSGLGARGEAESGN
jgi:oxygen-dependent protoporphyrinogen oxidase